MKPALNPRPHTTLIATLVLTLTSLSFASEWDNCLLWYDEPAQKWLEALPVGNGRLGAMCFGGADKARTMETKKNGVYDVAP